MADGHQAKIVYEKIDSWVKASNADLIISIQSNLGYELFSHKKKVLFVCENKPYFLGEKSDLLWLPKPDLLFPTGHRSRIV